VVGRESLRRRVVLRREVVELVVLLIGGGVEICLGMWVPLSGLGLDIEDDADESSSKHTHNEAALFSLERVQLATLITSLQAPENAPNFIKDA
jgi:hypothetical protein